MIVGGALTKRCMRDVRELYSLPQLDAEASSAASAALLLELYNEVPLPHIPPPTSAHMWRRAQNQSMCKPCICL